MMCCENGNSEMAKLLLDSEANPDLRQSVEYHKHKSLHNWRAGASQPSGANGAIFPLLIFIYLYNGCCVRRL